LFATTASCIDSFSPSVTFPRKYKFSDDSHIFVQEWRAYERNNYADEIFKFEHGPLTREQQRRMKVGEERQQQQGRPNSISPIQKMLRDYLKEFEIDEDDISGRRIQKFTFDK